MAPLWLPRSVPSAWCVPAIEPRPQQTAQTILGSSCTRRQGMRGVVQSGAPRVGTGCSGCHKWIYQRAGRRVGDALAAAEYGCCPVLLRRRLAHMRAVSDACCARPNVWKLCLAAPTRAMSMHPGASISNGTCAGSPVLPSWSRGREELGAAATCSGHGGDVASRRILCMHKDEPSLLDSRSCLSVLSSHRRRWVMTSPRRRRTTRVWA